MSKIHVGVDNLARTIAKGYVGVDGIARKIIKGYVGVSGIAQQVYSAGFYSYTGDVSEKIITFEGVEYLLLTLTSSGVLSIHEEVNADVWMCGSGGNGGAAQVADQYGGGTHYSGGGGGGGYFQQFTRTLSGETECTLGTAKNSQFGDVIAKKGVNGSKNVGGSGGSGGGAGIYSTGTTDTTIDACGEGCGQSTYPFGDTTNFQPHCAGGGGGMIAFNNGAPATNYNNGGNGGSNGSNGAIGTNAYTTKAVKASGGEYGGGAGGACTSTAITANGGNATFYGGGGGGAPEFWNYGSGIYKKGSAGKGYQGVVYVRIKLEDIA